MTLAVKDKGYQETTALGSSVKDYLRYKEYEQGCRPRTIEGYESVLYRMALLHPNMQASGWRLEEVRNFIYAAPNRSRPFWTAVVNDFWKWMWLEKRVPESPSARLRAPKKRKEIRTKVFSEAEVKALESLPELRDAVCMTLLFESGIRMSEARELQLMNIDLEHGDLTVVSGKGAKGRIVDISLTACQRVSDLTLLDGINPTDYLWYGYARGSHKYGQARGITRHKPIEDTRFYRWWYGCLEQAGVSRHNPHTTRHTYASRWLSGGESLSILSEEMGHESIATTKDLYGHLDRADKKAAVARLEAMRHG